MPIKYEKIPASKLAYATCIEPIRMPEILHLDDNAFDGMFDFTALLPATLKETDTLSQAIEALKATRQHLILITDADKHVIGILRSEDIQGQRPYQIMKEKNIQRGLIPIKHLMVPADAVLAFDYDQLTGSKIGNVVVTMHAHKKHYAIVQEKIKDNRYCIRGLFSISHLSQALGADVSVEIGQAHSIMELQRKLN